MAEVVFVFVVVAKVEDNLVKICNIKAQFGATITRNLAIRELIVRPKQKMRIIKQVLQSKKMK